MPLQWGTGKQPLPHRFSLRMVTTNDDGYAQALRMVRSHGEQRPYWTVRPGHNYHMTEIAAAIGYAQLKKLPSFLEKRRKNAELTTEKLNMTGKLLLPKEPNGRKHSWYLYTVRLRGVNAAKRNKIVDKLWNKNIEAGVYYSSPVHSTPLYGTRISLGEGDCLRLRKRPGKSFRAIFESGIVE